MGCDVGLDRLRQSQRDLGAMLGRPKLQLIIGIADVTSLEQNGGRSSPAKHMECRETVRVGS